MNIYKNTYKILFVDDEKELCKEFKEYVSRKTNHKVELAYNGQEALGKLEKENYDCIVLDLVMPVMSGEEAFPIIKAKYPKLSIIILTAHGNIKRAIKMVREGAYDFISKGDVEFEHILLQIEKGIKEKRIEEERYNDLIIFSKGAAHQFKNSAFRSSMELSLVENLIEELGLSKDNKDKLLAHIESLKDEASRAKSIALRMKAMDEKTKLNKTEIKVEGFMNNLIQYFSKQISRKRKVVLGKNLTLTIDSNVPNIFVDKHYMMEAYIDIIDNAYDAAIPEREGEIRCEINVKLFSDEDGDYVLFSFQDNGCGISDDNMEYIYTPFYTTKGSDGIGLGMPYIRCVVGKHKGRLEIDSELGKGTSVDVYIPVGNEATEKDIYLNL